ncbi:hypothetical protein [Caviibacter abscessus]|uniref:hypothetical protein n=1 Tax=Caviibacter abscessus TaxID=1766719 RepID=UPI00082BA4C5|nr:hypothetical protein [Caviibacter abscessus]
MTKKRIIQILFIIVLITLIRYIIYEINILNNTRKNIQVVNKTTKTIFKNELLENLVDKFKDIAQKNKVELFNFNFVKAQNKTYFKIITPEIENSSYMIAYEGISVIELYANIGVINEEKMKIAEKILVTLIEVSDKLISDEEAKRIFAMSSSKLDKDNLSSSIAYTNGLTYTLDVTEFGGLILSIK